MCQSSGFSGTALTELPQQPRSPRRAWVLGTVHAEKTRPLSCMGLVPSCHPHLLTGAAPFPELRTVRPPGHSWALPPCWKSGWFWLVCLFFWRNFESQANTLILTFLQPWPIFTACQQHMLARSHLSLSAVTLSPAPSAPLPRIRGEQSLRRKHH